MLDTDNPRSLAWVVQRLGRRVRQLHEQHQDLAQALADTPLWALAAVEPGKPGPDTDVLTQALQALAQRAWAMSEQIGRRHFSHASENRSVGA